MVFSFHIFSSLSSYQTSIRAPIDNSDLKGWLTYVFDDTAELLAMFVENLMWKFAYLYVVT